MVVVPLPLPAQHPRLQQAAELLRVQQFVPHLAVERLRVPVLPRRPRLDVQCPQARAVHPRPDRLGDELRPVVRPDVRRHAAIPHHPGQHRADRLSRHPPAHLQGQALPRVLVHQREPLQGTPVRSPVVEEIPRPDVVLVLRRPPYAAVDTRPQTPFLPLFPGDFQPLLPPEAVDALAVDPPALAPQQRPDAPVAVARMPANQRQHPRQQPLFLLLGLGHLPLGRARLPQHAAGAALGHAEGLLEVTRRLSPLGGGQNFFCTTSWSICLSRANSATRRLRRAFSTSSSLRRLASSAFMPPYWLRQRCRVGSLTPSFWQTWASVRPWARSASACRSFRMTCSGVCRVIGSSPCPSRGVRDSHSTWTTFWGADQREGRRLFMVCDDWRVGGTRFLKPITAFTPSEGRAYWDQ